MIIITERRITPRRAADKRVVGAIIFNAVLALIVGVAIGYFLGAAEAAYHVAEGLK